MYIQTPRLAVEAAQSKPVIPLCRSSAHSYAVHSSWPSSVYNRVWRLSHNKDLALRTLHARYVAADSHHVVLNQIANWSHRPKSVCNKVSARMTRVPIVLRFHPAFRRAFFQTLSEVPIPKELNLEILVAWKNSLPSLGGLLDRHNSHLCGRVRVA